jgi:nucleoside-diphosphate-sugar epimerase
MRAGLASRTESGEMTIARPLRTTQLHAYNAPMRSGDITLVTGSAGHLGEALVRSLRAAGRATRGIDILASPCTDVVGSISDAAVVERAMDGVGDVIHAATLHKPHVATHSRQQFVDTNITGTLNLLEAATRAGVRAFLFTSTTSAFGDALTPHAGAPAVWITEEVVPVPKNIYGVTKIAAEDLCQLAHRNQGLACLVLRTSRFFPEPDDDPVARAAYPDANIKANEFLHRRLDVEDVVSAHRCALDRAPALGFGRYIISATTPLQRGDAEALRRDAPSVVSRRVPGWEAVYAGLGWRMAPSIDRVYDNARARADLGWQPRYDFAAVLDRVRDTGDIRSPLARELGIKGYHGGAHAGGVYPTGPTGHGA